MGIYNSSQEGRLTEIVREIKSGMPAQWMEYRVCERGRGEGFFRERELRESPPNCVAMGEILLKGENISKDPRKIPAGDSSFIGIRDNMIERYIIHRERKIREGLDQIPKEASLRDLPLDRLKEVFGRGGDYEFLHPYVVDREDGPAYLSFVKETRALDLPGFLIMAFKPMGEGSKSFHFWPDDIYDSKKVGMRMRETAFRFIFG